jgi:hypothetical protein
MYPVSSAEASQETGYRQNGSYSLGLSTVDFRNNE